MPDNFPASDSKMIWQDQPAEQIVMTSEKIRQKTLELHAKTRRDVRRNIAAALVAVALSAQGIAWVRNSGLPSGPEVIFAFAIVWVLAGQYFLHRGMWSATLPGDAALSTGLEYYRQEIGNRRHLSRNILQWLLGPLILAIGGLILQLAMLGIRERGTPFAPMLPFLTLIAVWLVVVFVLHLRRRRELGREIDELNKIERFRG